MLVREVLAMTLVLGALFTPSRAEAQLQDQARYDALIAEAVSEFGDGHWEEARTLFLRAHEVKPNARTLRGAGMASFEMRAYVAAWRYLMQARGETRRALTRTQRREVDRLIVRAEGFIGRARIAVTPPSAAVTIDLRPVTIEDDGTILLDVGEHSVRATAPSYEPASSRVTIEATQVADLRITLERSGPRVVRVEHVDETSTVDPAAVVLLGSGGALAVGALAGIFWIKGRDSEIARCDAVAMSTIEMCNNGNTLSVQRTVAIGGTIAFAAGAVTLITIGVVRLLGARDGANSSTERDDTAHAHVDCGVAPAGVLCTGSF